MLLSRIKKNNYEIKMWYISDDIIYIYIYIYIYEDSYLLNDISFIYINIEIIIY